MCVPKSLNFVDLFICYRRKCKVSFNSGHTDDSVFGGVFYSWGRDGARAPGGGPHQLCSIP